MKNSKKKIITLCDSGVVDDYYLIKNLITKYASEGYLVHTTTDCFGPNITLSDWICYTLSMIEDSNECLFITPDTFRIEKRICKSTRHNMYEYSILSRNFIYAANLCKKIIWYYNPIDYSIRNFSYSVYTCLHRLAFEYIANKINTYNISEQDKLSKMIKSHDIDKLIMYQMMDKESSSEYHRTNSKHHIEYQKHNISDYYDIIESIIDWECAALTKPDKPLNARQTLDTFYKDKLSESEYKYRSDIISELGLDSSEFTEKDHKEFNDYIQRILANNKYTINLNGKWCITPDYIINEIQSYLYLK